MVEVLNPTVREPWQKLKEYFMNWRSRADLVANAQALLTKRRTGPSLVPAPSPTERLVLDPGLDFVFHKDGMIELTEAGFRRLGQAHSAGLDTVIEVEGRYLLHLAGPKSKVA